MPYDSNSSRSSFGLADDVANGIRADDSLQYDSYARRMREKDKENADKYMLSRDEFTKQGEAALNTKDVKETSFLAPERDSNLISLGLSHLTGIKGKRTKYTELRDSFLDRETEKNKNLYYESLKQQGSSQTPQQGGISSTITPPSTPQTPSSSPSAQQPTAAPAISTTLNTPIEVNDQMQSIYRSHLADTGSVPMYEKTAPTQNYQLGRSSAVDGEGFNSPEMQIKNDSDKGILA